MSSRRGKGRANYEGGDPVAACKLADERTINTLADRFEWTDRPERFDLIARWRSRTAEFARWRGRGASLPDVVIKAPFRFNSVADVRAAHERLRQFQGVAAPHDSSVGIYVTHGRGWFGDPPLLCMDYIGGVELGKLITEWNSTTDFDLMRTRMRSCGRFLAQVHNLTLVEGSSGEGGALRLARALHDRVAYGLLRPDLRAARLGDQLSLAERYGDFAPYNLRVTENDQMWLLDPPTGAHYAPVQQDLACFLHALDRDVVRKDRLAGGPPETDIRRELHGSFLRGYSDRARVAVLSAASLDVIRLYDTHRRIGLVRKRSRDRRFVDAARMLGSLRHRTGHKELF